MGVASAIVVVIDRLGAGWIGPYGNTWLDTPHFNRLAARSMLFETAIADSPDLAMAYRAYWSGQHAMQPESERPSLAALATAAGAKSVLITDDPKIVEHPLAGSFSEQRLVRPHDGGQCATEIEQTELFLLFSEAINSLEEADEPALVWIHARGMSGPWDAPYEMRAKFADEEDPEPPRLVVPPEKRLEGGHDPDEILGIAHAYAGQVALVDYCLGMLLDALDEARQASDYLLAVTSPRGYPLGEHHRIGPCDEALYAELLHVPLLIRFPGSEGGLARSQRIVQPHELFSTLAEACDWLTPSNSALIGDMRGVGVATSNAAYAAAANQRAIRTPAWFLRESRASDEPRYELFAKPDDQWEANEVSSRCSDVVEMLAAQLAVFEKAAAGGQLAEIPPLAELLCDVWR
jgi:arylsulfatase A-like enzyme